MKNRNSLAKTTVIHSIINTIQVLSKVWAAIGIIGAFIVCASLESNPSAEILPYMPSFVFCLLGMVQ